MKRVLVRFFIRLASLQVATVAKSRAFLLRGGKPGPRRTVVVLANDGMGDNLHRIPFFAALRELYPAEAFRLVVFVLPNLVPMFRRMPYFDEVRTAGLYSHGMVLWPFVGYIRWSIFHRADVWINLVRIRSIGYDFARQIADPAFSCAYDTELLSRHLPDEAAFQRNRSDRAYSLLLRSRISRNLLDDYREILHALPFRDRPDSPPDVDASFLVDGDFDIRFLGDEYAVFVPGAASAFRRWPVERFAAVARTLLSDRPRLRIAVVGTQAERHLGDAVASVSPDRVTNLCGRTTLPRLGTVLSHASFVLSNETGTAHYSAALGVRTICLLGGGDFNSYFPMPRRPHVRSVFRHDSCFGCGWSCSRARLHGSLAPCIDAISPEDVETSISKAW